MIEKCITCDKKKEPVEGVKFQVLCDGCHEDEKPIVVQHVTYEYCSNCESEVQLPYIFTPQTCPECGAKIYLCNMCERVNSCSECPLE